MFMSGVYVALFACCLEISTALTEEHKSRLQDTFEEVGRNCAKENNISEDDIAAFKERKFPEGKEAACFSACVLKSIGLDDSSPSKKMCKREEVTLVPRSSLLEPEEYCTCKSQDVHPTSVQTQIDDEGQLSHDSAVENAKGVFGEGDEIKAIEEFIDTCKDSVEEGGDVCERAKLAFKCFVEHSDKFDF